MKKFGDFICKHKVAILVISILLLIPAAIGYFNTKTNYDINNLKFVKFSTLSDFD